MHVLRVYAVCVVCRLPVLGRSVAISFMLLLSEKYGAPMSIENPYERGACYVGGASAPHTKQATDIDCATYTHSRKMSKQNCTIIMLHLHACTTHTHIHQFISKHSSMFDECATHKMRFLILCFCHITSFIVPPANIQR